MEFIPFIQLVLLLSAILFAIVLIISYLYTKFFKKEKEEEQIINLSDEEKGKQKTASKKRTVNYTASADSQKLYVNTEKHRKHRESNKAATKPQRFQILNKTDED